MIGAVQQIIETNNVVRKALEEGLPIPTLMENWDFLQNQCAMEINSAMPGVRRDPSEASVHIRQDIPKANQSRWCHKEERLKQAPCAFFACSVS